MVLSIATFIFNILFQVGDGDPGLPRNQILKFVQRERMKHPERDNLVDPVEEGEKFFFVEFENFVLHHLHDILLEILSGYIYAFPIGDQHYVLELSFLILVGHCKVEGEGLEIVSVDFFQNFVELFVNESVEELKVFELDGIVLYKLHQNLQEAPADDLSVVYGLPGDDARELVLLQLRLVGLRVDILGLFQSPEKDQDVIHLVLENGLKALTSLGPENELPYIRKELSSQPPRVGSRFVFKVHRPDLEKVFQGERVDAFDDPVNVSAAHIPCPAVWKFIPSFLEEVPQLFFF